jgi:hypothetical protein
MGRDKEEINNSKPTDDMDKHGSLLDPYGSVVIKKLTCFC